MFFYKYLPLFLLPTILLACDKQPESEKPYEPLSAQDYCAVITKELNLKSSAEPSPANISEEAAKETANKAFISRYGEEKIKEEYPLSATSCNDTWIIHGSMPKNMLGGAAQAVISKKDGAVLRIIHGK